MRAGKVCENCVTAAASGALTSGRPAIRPSRRATVHEGAVPRLGVNSQTTEWETLVALITLVFATTEAVWEVSSTAGNPSPRARSAWGASARSTWGASSAGIPSPSAAGIPSPSANSTWEVPAAGTPSPRGRNDKVVVKVDAVEVSGWEVSMEGIPSPEVKNA